MSSSVVLRLVAGLGIFQGLVGILIVSSCRCTGGTPFGARLLKIRAFKKFYRYHCYLWWPFWISVALHAVLAVYLTGFPF